MNKIIEAYTWKRMGHRENHLSRRQVSSVRRKRAVGDEVTNSESKTKDATRQVSGRTVGVRRRGTYVEKCQELGRPGILLGNGVGEVDEMRQSDGVLGVRPAHSTLRRESRLHGEGAGRYAKSTKETSSDGKKRGKRC